MWYRSPIITLGLTRKGVCAVNHCRDTLHDANLVEPRRETTIRQLDCTLTQNLLSWGVSPKNVQSQLSRQSVASMLCLFECRPANSSLVLSRRYSYSSSSLSRLYDFPFVARSICFQLIRPRITPCFTPMLPVAVQTGEQPEISRLRKQHRRATAPGRYSVGKTTM